MSSSTRLAGTCVAIRANDDLGGVLLRGPSGAGKSDLALRLIDGGAFLVADDQVMIAAKDGVCIARAPDAIRGLMEVRGLGIVRAPSIESTPLVLIVDLATPPDVPRLAEPTFEVICGAALPRLVLSPFENSTPAKIRLAVQVLKNEAAAGVTFPFAGR